MSALKAQQRGGQNGRRDKGDQTPQQIAGSRCRAKKVTQKQCEATLGAPVPPGSGTAELSSWTKALAAMTEKSRLRGGQKRASKVRNQVEKRQLQHSDDDREQHGRKMAGR